MGRGGKDASLEVFETQLKKLLHIIDKLPKPDREKAVDILKISANHYSNLTVSQSLQDAVVMPVSQAYCTSLEQEQQYYTTAPSSFPSYPQAVAGASRLESESILAELGGLGEERQGVVAGLEEDWDQHVGGADLYCPTSSPTCALCLKTFTLDEFVRHYQPVSCRGCRQELCNSDIFNLHYHACR